MNYDGTGVGDMPHDDLVKRLRHGPPDRLLDEAAARIEALEAENVRIRDAASELRMMLDTDFIETDGTFHKYDSLKVLWMIDRLELATLTGDKP